MQVLVRSARLRVVVAGVAVLSFAAVAAGTASATLPSACVLLTKAHPEQAFGHGGTLPVTKRTQHKYGTGKYVTLQCSENVGAQSVSISLSSAGAGGFGGVSDIKTTHPSGLGAGDSLITGKAVPSGAPVDFVEFHRGAVYVDISANGATPAVLTTFARQVYKALA
jgi:hypothetical protein